MSIQKQKKVGLFGGAFDPPHFGHQRVATELAGNVLDEVWFVPVYTHPWAARYGKQSLTPYTDRVAMLESILGENQAIQHYQDVSFTYPTLQHFEKTYPDTHFSWIMGSEYISRFGDFLAGHPGLKDYTFYVYPRKGYPLESLYPFMVGLSNMEEIDISSTKVRDAVKLGEPLEGLVPPFVKKYIETSGYYKE